MPAVSPTDEQLLQASLRDPEAFGVLYDRHHRVVFAHLRRRSGSAELAADLTAEVFAAALIARERFVAGRGPVIAWLLGIANHKLVDARRRGRAEQHARQRLGMQRHEFTDEQLERAEQLVDVAERRGELWAAVDALPPHQREALLGRVVDGSSYAELASTLGFSETVVRQRVSRGLRRLARTMGSSS